MALGSSAADVDSGVEVGCTSPEQCDDGDDCTNDWCDGTGTCQNDCMSGIACNDGQLLTVLQPTGKDGKIRAERAQIVLLPTATKDGRPGVAVAGRTPEGEVMLAVFVLPELKK